MTTAQRNIPPDIQRYLQGASEQCRQFGFLIGTWNVAATRFKPDGSVLVQYPAVWTAQYLNEGRMVMDDFRALAPNGQAISSYVTLRTYCETTQRWEMSGLAAGQPAANAQWHGVRSQDDMLLHADGVDPGGQRVQSEIRFFNITPDSFAWESHSRTDDAHRWIRSASLLATKAVHA